MIWNSPFSRGDLLVVKQSAFLFTDFNNTVMDLHITQEPVLALYISKHESQDGVVKVLIKDKVWKTDPKNCCPYNSRTKKFINNTGVDNETNCQVS